MGGYQAGKVKMARMAKNGRNSETFLNSKGVLYFLENFRKSCHSLPFLDYGGLMAVASKVSPIGEVLPATEKHPAEPILNKDNQESEVRPMGLTFPSTESQARGTNVYRREQRFTL